MEAAVVNRLMCIVLIALFLPSAYAGALTYPATESVDCVDTYHGIDVADPYQWLEQDVRQSERVRQWVQAQNGITNGYLQSLDHRQAIAERLKQLWDYDKIGTPWKVANRYFVFRKEGLQNHSILYTMDKFDGPRRVVFNPNDWSEDGTVALAGVSVSPDGNRVAYSVQEAGSDWRTWKIRCLDTGRDLPEVFAHLKFTRLSWTADSSGVYYSKYPEPDAAQRFTAMNENMKVMFHRLGTDPADDRVVHYNPEHPDWTYGAAVSDDGRWLVISTRVGSRDGNRVTCIDLSRPEAAAIELIDNFENDYGFIDNDGATLFFLTNHDAPNRRLIAISAEHPQQDRWKEIVPQTDSALQSVSRMDGKFICVYLRDVTSQVKIFDAQGAPVQADAFPALGTISGFAGKDTDTETFYSFQSMTTPPSVFRFDLKTGRSTLLETTTVGFDPDRFICRQVFYSSKDGTRIPMFVAHKKDLVQTGDHPTLLYGYGGFSISMRPYFSPARVAWMEMGGIYAVANLRGGGEFGRTWHEAGKRLNKQNVFDDFMAAAEYLIAEKFTSPAKLAIQGGSNGGLLVGACMAQRPDLFAAAIPSVGVMDMLRYDRFTAGRFWVDEYGAPSESKQMFDCLMAYSPYHNLKKGTAYPATLVVTADTDDRVVPAHSFKFAARLQEVHQGTRPVLIRIETRAGHGSGKPTAMALEEIADIYAFLAQNLSMSLKSGAVSTDN
jgi:prolyl oligopeptidase